ncbi:MAG: hypothetical protein ACKVP0_00310 [Pirellulaceae bacterium]
MRTTWRDMLQPVPVLAAANLILLTGIAAIAVAGDIYPVLFLVVMGAFEVGRTTKS